MSKHTESMGDVLAIAETLMAHNTTMSDDDREARETTIEQVRYRLGTDSVVKHWTVILAFREGPMFMQAYESVSASGAENACRDDVASAHREVIDSIVIECEHEDAS